jgi:DNA-binding transcriptional LysR family regulator
VVALELEDLRALVAVVEHSGFRRAADALYVSQPSLTRRIARLEQELHVQLLERTPTGVRVTPQGATFLSGARRVMATLEETRSATTGAWAQTITLGCTTTAAGSFLTDFLARWIPDHPRIRVRMIEDSPARNRQRLLDLECDAAIAATPLPPEVESLPLTSVEVRALIPPGHALEEEGPLDIRSLQGWPLLVIGEQFRSTKLLRAAALTARVQPDVVFECSVGHTLEALVRAGVGIGVLSDAVDRGRRTGDLLSRPLCDASGGPLGFDLHVAWVRDRQTHPVVRRFVEDLSAYTTAAERTA